MAWRARTGKAGMVQTRSRTWFQSSIKLRDTEAAATSSQETDATKFQDSSRRQPAPITSRLKTIKNCKVEAKSNMALLRVNFAELYRISGGVPYDL